MKPAKPQGTNHPAKPQGTNHHMPVEWKKEVETAQGTPAVEASLADKTSIICHLAALFLQSGAGGWRVRDAVNRASAALGVTSTVSIGLTDLECTVRQSGNTLSQTVVIPDSGVNTNLILDLDTFLKTVDEKGSQLSVHQYHAAMDDMKAKKQLYSPAVSALASAFACGAFTFLLGGGPIEMLCAFIGAGLGQLVRKLLLGNKLNQLLAAGAGVVAACASYVFALFLLSFAYPDALQHQMGYIGAMLFVIPGFPLITAALDMYLFDMRSGIERLTYAVMVIAVATLLGWLLAVAFQLQPGEFISYELPESALLVLRLLAAFVGVFGFSIMFNSPVKVALTAGAIGAVADTTNLELVNYFSFAPEIGALTGALIAGFLASAVWRATKCPRTVITVPSVVIMIPGLYMYKAMFYLASFEVNDAATCLIRAVMVVVFLPLGLCIARALTDPHWRHTS